MGEGRLAGAETRVGAGGIMLGQGCFEVASVPSSIAPLCSHMKWFILSPMKGEWGHNEIRERSHGWQSCGHQVQEKKRALHCLTVFED